MPKYREIRELFKIEKVTNEYILTKINKNYERVYVYKVEPLLFLDVSETVQRNIIDLYHQFLRECKFKIQIIISNNRLNVEKYIEKYFSYNENIPLDIYEDYINDIKEKIDVENIYETRILLIISENSKEKNNVEEYDRVIYKLEEIGCKVNRICSKNELEQILYKHLNKI